MEFNRPLPKTNCAARQTTAATKYHNIRIDVADSTRQKLNAISGADFPQNDSFQKKRGTMYLDNVSIPQSPGTQQTSLFANEKKVSA